MGIFLDLFFYFSPLSLPILSQTCPLHLYPSKGNGLKESSKIKKRAKGDNIQEWVLNSSAFLCIEIINIECNSYWIYRISQEALFRTNIQSSPQPLGNLKSQFLLVYSMVYGSAFVFPFLSLTFPIGKIC